MAEQTLSEWLEFGYAKGWVAPGFCQTHDMTPMTPEEVAEFDDGGDPCIPVLRVWIPTTPESPW